MIDTKIACQCGHHFKFGMDLVAGRAPDGLACPTCGAPATAACNALVDFLSGREPAPPSADTRPLKEVRVTCTCGARYKFDLELAEQTMPAPVVCPNCQIDLTPLANEEIRGYVAKHSAGLATSGAISAPLAAPAPEVPALTPAAEPIPASPASRTPDASASAPPSPASPTPTAPPAPAAPTITPVSDPFGSPTGKSSGPNLKPLEVPKPNRPPPGSRPAAPAATKPASAPPAAAAAATPAAKYTPAKPAAHHNQHAHAAPAANAGEPSLGRGVGGALGGALIGAGIWFALLQIPAGAASPGKLGPDAFPTSWMALVVGTLAGFGARLLGRGTGSAFGGAACGAAIVVTCLMAWLTMMRHIDRQLGPQLKAQYVAELANAQAAIKATDAELKVVIGRTTPNFGMGGPVTSVSDDAVKAYREKELPKLRDFVAGKPSRAEWERPHRARTRAGSDLVDVWQETFGIFGLLFILAGVFAAAKIPMK